MPKKQVYNKARYERQKQNPEWIAKRCEYQRELYARSTLNPEWVSAQTEKRRKKQQDPEWAAKRAETKRRYDERVQNDSVKRKRRNQLVNQWKNHHKALCAELDKNKREKRKAVDPVKVIWRNIKGRATRSGIPFDLEESDLAIPSACPVLGIPIAPFIGKFHPNTVSVDRIVPEKGYTKGNVQVVSMLVNRLKSNCTDPDVFRKIADYIEANLKA